MVNYNNLWNIMNEKNITKTQLRLDAKLSSSTFAKLSKNQNVALDVLVRICKVLDCKLGDICNITEEK